MHHVSSAKRMDIANCFKEWTLQIVSNFEWQECCKGYGFRTKEVTCSGPILSLDDSYSRVARWSLQSSDRKCQLFSTGWIVKVTIYINPVEIR